ncbi:MAG: T9SS type A sorting domain-containing protein [bacterium]|nr:T9SS type A sorting domain-containing protein [bacterium]
MKNAVSILICLLTLVCGALAQNSEYLVSSALSRGTEIAPLKSDVQTDNVAWTQVAGAPHFYGRSGTAVLGGYMYCFGSEGSNIAQAFNLSTEQWVASTPPLMGYDNWPAVATGNAIFLIGRSESVTIGDDVQKFVPTAGGPTGVWTLAAHYPYAAYGICAAWDGGDYIYAAGGFTDTQELSAAYKYQISRDIWDAIADLPVPMGFAGAAFINGQFHVMGGEDTGNTHFAYNPGTNQWVEKAAVPTVINFATYSVTSNANFIFSVGGGGGYYVWPATNAVQIYNPITDTWAQETALPVARGCNNACWAGNGTVISGGGFVTTTGWSTITYKGSGFPGGTPATVDLTITAVNPPIVIPVNGGTFQYNINVHNQGTSPQTFTVWNKIRSASTYYEVFGPVTRTLPGGANPTRTMIQNVAASIPAGVNYYISYIGAYPNVVLDSSYFTFTKTALSDGGAWVEESSCSGDFFEEYAAVGAMHASPLQSENFVLLGAYPNPFNPTTTIRYELRAASCVTLEVFNVEGRVVGVQHVEPLQSGAHEITFDGSGLPSGVYLYKLEAGDYTATNKRVLMK